MIQAYGMTLHSRLPQLLVVLAAALQLQLLASSAAVNISFPTGTDWNNATVEQIRQAVYEAVNANPEMKDQIITSALESALQTGRFPKLDASAVVDPGVVTYDTLAAEIRSAAETAFVGAPLAPIVESDGKQTISSEPIDDGGGSGGGGGGVPPPLPGGFGGGSGSSTGGGSQYE